MTPPNGEIPNDELGEPILKVPRRLSAQLPTGWQHAALWGVGFGLGLLMLMLFADQGRLATWGLLAIVAVGFAALAVWHRISGHEVVFHKHGAIWRQFDRDVAVIRYEEVDELTFRSARYYVNGVYSGTFFEITLRSAQSGRSIHAACRHQEQSGLATGYHHSHEIEKICFAVATRIADRMQAAVERGDSVPWTKNLRISNEGIEVAAGWSNPELIPWAQIARVSLDEGSFQLLELGKSKPSVTLDAYVPNFYPGYDLVQRFLEALPSPQPAAETADAPPAPTGAEIVLRYDGKLEDHIAVRRHYHETTSSGRIEWLCRIAGWPLLLGMAVLVLAGANHWWFDKLSASGFVLVALLVALGIAASLPIANAICRYLEREQMESELRAAHRLWQQGEGPNPFSSNVVTLAPWGYLHEDGDGQGRYNWEDISQIVLHQGYIFTYLAGTRLSDEQLGLIIPPRAFPSGDEAKAAYRTLREWHGKSLGRVGSEQVSGG